MTFLADRVTNVPVSFRQLRMKDAEGVVQEGVVGATDLKVVQRAAGANMSVDFSVGAGWINVESGTRSGLVHFYNDAVANVAVTASNATNPRVDFAIVRYNDSSIPAGTGGNTPTPEVLAGTPTATAQATNPAAAGYLLGAPTLPNDAILLAAFTVPATATSIVTANILDRRKWARGAYSRQSKTNANVTNATTSMALIDAATLQARIECSGVPVRVTLRLLGSNGTAGSGVGTNLLFDGALIDGTAVLGQAMSAAAGAPNEAGYVYTIAAPTPGSHLFAPTFAAVTSGTATGSAGVGIPCVFVVEEIVRPNTNNGTT